MIELFLKAIDRLIALAKIKEKRLKVRYDEIYKPSFEELQTVHTDYLAMFTKFQSMLDAVPDSANMSDTHAKAAIKWLKEQRVMFAPVRAKLRDFDGLIAQLPKSCLIIEREFLEAISYYFGAGELIDHGNTSASTNLVDMLSEALRNPQTPVDGDTWTPTVARVRTHCDELISGLESQWRAACEKFNELRFELAQATS